MGLSVRGVVVNLVIAFMFLLSNLPCGYAFSFGSVGNRVVSSGVLLNGVELTDSGLVFSWGSGGKEVLGSDSDNKEIKELLSYYYTGLAIPEDNWWVDLFILNTEDDVMGLGLENTLLGYVMLDADLKMKRLINTLMSADSKTGQLLWNELSRIGVNSFMPRFWMVPGEIKIYTNNSSAYIKSAKIKVKVEIMDPNLSGRIKEKIAGILRRIVIPKVESTINSSADFTKFRQAFYCLILASWTKSALRGNNLSNKLVSLVNSYITPDVGTVRVDRFGFLTAFARDYISSKGDWAEIVVRGGGSDLTGIPDELEKGRQELEPKDLKGKLRRDGGFRTDIPSVNANIAEGYRLSPREVGIYGNVRFEGIGDAKDVVGSNVIIVNLSDEPLVITEDFIGSRKNKNQWFNGKLANVLIVKDKKGKIHTIQLLPKLDDNELAIKVIDTIGKTLSNRRKIAKKGIDLSLVFSQRPGEEISKEDLELIKLLFPDVKALLQRIASSSTRVRTGKGPHLVPVVIGYFLAKGYFWRWIGLEGPRENRPAQEYAKAIEREMKALLAIEKGDISALKELYGEKQVEGKTPDELKRAVFESLAKLRGEILSNKELNGDGIDMLDKMVVGMMKEYKDLDLVYSGLKMVRKALFDRVEKEMLDATFAYGQISSELSVSTQIENGWQNFDAMLKGTRKMVFGDLKIEDLLNRLAGKLSERQYSIVKEVAGSEDMADLARLKRLISDLREAVVDKELINVLTRLYDLKEFELAYADLKKTFDQVKKNISEGRINPRKKDGLRVAYLPMKGDPWQNGHIWVIAALLATGAVDKVVVTVDNGDPRKPKLSAGAIRGPMSQILLNRIFGPDLVEFETLPFERPKYFTMTGEEILPHIVSDLMKKYQISKVYYVAGSDHAKVVKTSAMTKEQLESLEKLIEELNKSGVPVGFSKELGMFFDKTLVAEGLAPEKGPKLNPDNTITADVELPGEIFARLKAIEGGTSNEGIDGVVYDIVQFVTENLGVEIQDKQALRERIASLLNDLSPAMVSLVLERVAPIAACIEGKGKVNLSADQVNKAERVAKELVNTIKKETTVGARDNKSKTASANITRKPGGLLLSAVKVRFFQ